MGVAGHSPLDATPQNDLEELLLGKRASLNPLFNPKTVAVIDAPEQPGTVGYKVLSALLNSPIGDAVFPVDRNRSRVMAVQAFPKISAVPAAVDLAVIASPKEYLSEIIGECAEALVKAAIVLSDGVSGCGEEDSGLGHRISEQLKGSRLRVLGPGSLGVINPHLELNATPGLPMPLGGSVAFVSQSIALGGAILEWSLKEIVGFSAFVHVGSMLDVGWGDLIDYFGSDPRTQTILLHIVTMGNVRSFLSAAREVSLKKPIIVIKAGRSQATARAMVWQLDGGADDEVLDAAFRRVGVLRVDTINDLFFTADALSKQPRPKGPRLMVVSNASGPEVLAADSVVAMGGELAELSPEGRREFDSVLPVHVSQRAGGDVRDDGNPEAYVKAVEIAARDSNCDGLLLVTVPQAFSDPRKATELLLNMRDTAGKPVLACLLGGSTAAKEEIVTRACIPTLPSPHTAARVFSYMWRYSYNLRGIYETPMFRSDGPEQVLRQLATNIVDSARDGGRSTLTEVEAISLLAAYGISTVTTRLAGNEEEAVRIASEIGFPVELQIVCDGGAAAVAMDGMPLDLFDAENVRSAWKMIMRRLEGSTEAGHRFAMALQPKQRGQCYDLRIASKLDPQLGPVLLFGLGGTMSNVFRDHAVGLPPLNATLARRVMERTRIYRVLHGADGHAHVDLAELEGMLVRFSELMVEQPWIRELEINLSAGRNSLLARSTRIEVHGPEVRREQLPRPAIRPYPIQYVSSWVMKDGQAVTIRPIRAEDEPLMIKFHERLSDRSVYLRYFQGMALDQRTTHDQLTRICFIDYDREIALVAERRDPHTEERRIIALGNLTKMHRGNDGEIAAITSDDCQGRGLGSEMMRRLLRVARDENLERVIGTTLPENRQMCAMLKRLGFRISVNLDDNLVEGELLLRS